MRSHLKHLPVCLRAFFWRSGSGRSFAMLVVLATALSAGLVSAGDAGTSEDRQYPAYTDPEKPTISYVLSQESYVVEFQERFSLSDRELASVLSAVRRENEALSKAYAESQQIVESNGELSVEQVKGKVEASGYHRKVRKAVARTRAAVEDVLPDERRQEFRAWVEDRWQQERQRFNQAPQDLSRMEAASGGMTFRVFATQYHGYTNYEVALPYRKLKFNGGYQVQLSRDGSYWPWAPVKEVGPWNTYDNYWAQPGKRVMWSNLRRGLPEAQAAYYNNYNRGRDEFGRKVLNPAGVDLTPAVAARLGLKKYQNAWIYVYMPWVTR